MIKFWNKGACIESYDTIEIRFLMVYALWFSKDKIKNEHGSIRIVR